MTQENKELLLKDLCGRLPYGVKIKCSNCPKKLSVTGILGEYVHHTPYYVGGNTEINTTKIDEVKPYLRPISSMMQGEWENMTALIYQYGRVNRNPDNKNELLLWLSMDGNDMPISLMEDVFTWLNSHHFDYRGLIEKGLAIEAAPKGMYKFFIN